jgi:hypothetical protein
MMLLAMAGVAALLAGREAIAGAALVGAAATKLSAAFLLPFALVEEARRRSLTRFGLGAAVAAALTAAAGLIAFGGGLTDSLAIAGENQDRTSRHSVPVTLAHDLGVGVGGVRAVALLGYAIVVVMLLRWTWRGGDWLRAAGWAALGLLVATSYLTPWYTVWALPLAAVSRDRALVLAAIAFTGFQLIHQVPL